MGLFGGSNTADATIRFNADAKPAIAGIGQLKGAVTGLIGAFTVMQVAKFTSELVKAGDEDIRMARSFNTMTKSIGVDSDMLLSKLRGVTKGFVEEAKVQQLAYKGFVKGFSGNEIAAMMELATNYALSTGEDVGQVIEELFSGSQRSAAMALQKLGVVVETSGGKLKLNIEDIKRKAEELGAAIGDGADSPVQQAERLRVKWEELKGAVGRGLVPITGAALTNFLKFLDRVENSNFKRLVDESLNFVTKKQKDALAAIQTPLLDAIDKKEDGLNKRSSSGVDPEEQERLAREAKARAEKQIALNKEADAYIAAARAENMAQTFEGRLALIDQQEYEAYDILMQSTDVTNADIAAVEQKFQNMRLEEWQKFWKEKETREKAASDKEKAQAEKDAEAKKQSDDNKIRREKETQDELTRVQAAAMNERYQIAADTGYALMKWGEAISSSELNHLKKSARSQKEYDEKKKKIEAEAARREYLFAIFMQGIAVARSIEAVVTTAAAESKEGIYGLIAGAVVASVEMAALVAAMPNIEEPKFESGRIGRSSRRRSRDSFSAVVGEGETIIPATQSSMHSDLLSAIRNNTANTAAGMRGLKGGTTVVFNGVSTEQMLQASVAITRRQSVGRRV